MKLLDQNLLTQGFILRSFELSKELKIFIKNEDWVRVDHYFKDLTSASGRLFQFLQKFHEFNSIEFIISIRDSKNDWEEDGIWHDDGSRLMAFSLSLAESHEKIIGGKLGIRKKSDENFQLIPTPPFGEIIIFLTGEYGYEHKIHKVEAGKRIIIAGWCS